MGRFQPVTGRCCSNVPETCGADQTGALGLVARFQFYYWRSQLRRAITVRRSRPHIPRGSEKRSAAQLSD